MSILFTDIKIKTIEKREIIQHKLLSSSGFVRYCHDRGLSTLSEKHVVELWFLGLIQADLICSDLSLNIDGLILVETDHDGKRLLYADNRPVPIKDSWSGSFSEPLTALNDIELSFHPFRFYSLLHIERTFSYRLNSLQYLMNENGASAIVDLYNKKWLPPNSGEKFSEKFTKLNNVISLAVFSDPYAYQKVFNSIRWSPPDSEQSIRSKIEQRKQLILKVYKELNLENVEKIRHDLCLDVELLDSNKILHIMLRMMNAKMRQDIKGKLGGSMLLFSMSEFIRRCAEASFNEELPEEDELGFGVWMNDVKKIVYGSNRLYDSKGTVKKEFFRQYGADHSTRIRCYFEGETEYGAFRSLLGVSDKIDLINLKGKVAEKGHVAFRDSLRSDIKNQVFSIVVIDKDRDDYVRTVRKACADDEICGRVFFLQPDFEFGNFSVNEMIDILKQYAIRKDADKSSLDKIDCAVISATNGKELENAARNSIPQLADIGKGEEWGEMLMDYALLHPVYPINHGRSGRRVIIEIAELLLRCVSGNFNYVTTRKKYQINPNDGMLVERVDEDVRK